MGHYFLDIQYYFFKGLTQASSYNSIINYEKYTIEFLHFLLFLYKKISKCEPKNVTESITWEVLLSIKFSGLKGLKGSSRVESHAFTGLIDTSLQQGPVESSIY